MYRVLPKHCHSRIWRLIGFPSNKIFAQWMQVDIFTQHIYLSSKKLPESCWSGLPFFPQLPQAPVECYPKALSQTWENTTRFVRVPIESWKKGEIGWQNRLKFDKNNSGLMLSYVIGKWNNFCWLIREGSWEIITILLPLKLSIFTFLSAVFIYR